MNTKLMLAGRNKILHEGIRYSLRKDGYNAFINVGTLSFIKNSIMNETPDIIIWDDVIIQVSFSRIFHYSKNMNNDVRSVLILNSRKTHLIAEGLLNGITGFVHMKNGIRELRHCLSAVRNDLIFISPDLSGRAYPPAKIRKSELEVKNLTSRELTILRLINEDHTNKEIAQILSISYRTVQNHRQNICNKLGLSGRNKLYQYAKQCLGLYKSAIT